MSLPRDYHAARWAEPMIMELGTPGERGVMPPGVEPEVQAAVGDVLARIPAGLRRQAKPRLPEVSQPQVLRHYLRLAQMTLGFDVTPDASLGTCTMKYSPKVNEQLARMPEMADIHPLQDETTAQGMLEIMYRFGQILAEISGLDVFNFQPAGGAQGIFTNACIMRAHHASRGEADRRTEIITTAFSHPADAATPAVAGFRVITLMPGPNGYPELEALRAVVSDRTAGLMMTNPEDTGIFNPHIQEFVRLVHAAGGLCAHDQANANGILGVVRTRDIGFDMCQFNLHKTFSIPHGSIGGSCGAVGVTTELAKYLPVPVVEYDGERYQLRYDRPESIGKIRSFLGNAQAVLRGYAWVMALGADGLRRVAETAVLNNNYLATRLAAIDGVTIPYAGSGRRLQEVRYSWESLHQATGVSTEDVRRRVVDFGLQSYFTSHHPMLVPEPFTLEPSESLSRADLDEYAATLEAIAAEGRTHPEVVKSAPHRSSTHQIDTNALDDPDRWAMTWRAYQRKHGAGAVAGTDGQADRELAADRA
jgi:glycine cleavage system P protein (glycine dehydrogenase) subunit 2